MNVHACLYIIAYDIFVIRNIDYLSISYLLWLVRKL